MGQGRGARYLDRVSSAARYDIVVVGARCAGATFATLMSRAGARVLLVDKAALPSDLVLSTHTLHPSGARVLRRLGLGSRLLAEAPPIRTLRIGRGTATLDVHFPAADAEHCPRRRTLDGWLLDAAREAGTTVLERATALRLEQDAGRVTGLHLGDRAGREQLVRADLVVGADGRDSFVARAVGAAEYLDYPAPRVIYWSYWPAPRGYGAEQPGMLVANRSGSVHLAFHTEADQVLVGCAPPREQARAFRRDALGALRADVAAEPLLAALSAGPPSDKMRGYIPSHYFFREPVGPGWLLLGDAGMHQDFVTGNGMSEALVQAETAARALLAGPAQLERWWRERDVAALPMYLFGRVQGARGVPSRLEERVLEHAARTPALAARFARSMTGELSPLEVVSPSTAMRVLFGGLLRGERGLLADFVQRARSSAELGRIQAGRRVLLARCAAPAVARVG